MSMTSPFNMAAESLVASTAPLLDACLTPSFDDSLWHEIMSAHARNSVVTNKHLICRHIRLILRTSKTFHRKPPRMYRRYPGPVHTHLGW
jgi:hypothetical protein